MRVHAYIDGFNFYYRALRRRPHLKWLNLRALAEALVDDADEVTMVRYFTARVSARAGDPDAPRRQQIYLNALKTLPEEGFKCHFGNFLSNSKWRPISHPKWNPHVSVQILNTEEKGSDVNLATHLMNDARLDRFDAALVFSQDTDLVEPMRIVKEQMGKRIGLVWLDGRKEGGKLARLADFVRHTTPARLAAAQFPDELMGKNGHVLKRPASWTSA